MDRKSQEEYMVPLDDESLINTLKGSSELEPVLDLALKMRQQQVVEQYISVMLESLTGINISAKEIVIGCLYCDETFKIEVQSRVEKTFNLECSSKSFFRNPRKMKITSDGNGRIKVSKVNL